MERIWLQSYPAGTPQSLDFGEYSSLKDLIERSFAQHRDKIAYQQLGARMSYGELERLSERFGAWLQQTLGLKKGDRIAIMLPNVMQYPVVMFGALRAGLTVVNTNPLYTAEELRHQLNDSGASAIVVLENFAATVQQVVGSTKVKNVILTGIGDLLGFPKGALVNFVVKRIKKMVPAWDIPGALQLKDVLRDAASLRLAAVDVTREDIAYLQYTGGTTGISKGAMLTHANMVANVMQARAWFMQVNLKDIRYVCALPLYHIFSLTANCLLFATLGGTGLLITNPRDFPGFVKDLQHNPPMFFMGVNTLFNALMNTPGFDKIDFSQLAVTLGGGMAVQRAVAERWKAITGKNLTQGWGLTETSPAVCVCPLVGPDSAFNGSVGLPLPSTEVGIFDDDGRELALGEVGEICVRGPQVMRGYWQRPDETAKVMLPGFWLRTGDVGRIDARGFVYIEDRKKDMIIVSGFKVYPNEVEDVVAQLPGVLEVAAVAQPDPHSGEVVALYIVRKDPDLTAEDVLQHCHKNLTGYKQPRHVYFRESLPKSNVGKILRRELRQG